MIVNWHANTETKRLFRKKGENNLKSNENTLLSIAIFLVNRHFLGPDYMWNL